MLGFGIFSKKSVFPSGPLPVMEKEMEDGKTKNVKMKTLCGQYVRPVTIVVVVPADEDKDEE